MWLMRASDEVTKSCDAGQVAVDGWVEWGATSVNNQAICYGSSLSVRKRMTDGYLTNYIMAYNYTTYRAGFKTVMVVAPNVAERFM